MFLKAHDQVAKGFHGNSHNFGYETLFWACDQSNRNLKRGACHDKSPTWTMQGLIHFFSPESFSKWSYEHFFVFSIIFWLCFRVFIWLMTLLGSVLILHLI